MAAKRQPGTRAADYFTRLAKEKGYPARSIFKLEEMQVKYRLFRPSDAVLDLGAAPGSWSQYVLETLTGKGRLVAVDLNALSLSGPPPANLKFIKGSLFDEAVVAEIRAAGPYRCVLSDAAPHTTGSSFADAHASLELAGQVVTIAETCLASGGNLALKIYQGGEEREVLERLRALFRTARAVKPAASRSISFEVYYVGIERLPKP